MGVPEGARTIRARRVGYAPATQAVTVTSGATASASFALTVSVAQLQEVVINAVTGQAQTRVQGGTNPGYVKVDSLNMGAITKMADVLQGRVAGVNLQGAAGTAGSSQRVRIRGANSLSLSNEPLLYVDGVLVSNSKGGISLGGQDYSRLNDINAEEIDNVEILKGPAASAIYGSAAANGVILISTKRGKAGAPQYRVYAETGTQKDVNNYPLNYAALTAFNPAGNYYDIPNGGILNIRTIFGAGAPYDICPNYRAAIPVGTTVNGLSNCTQDVILSFDQFRDERTTPYQNGSLNKAGLNVSGGGDAITYFLGAEKSRELGVLRPNSVDKVNLRSNLNAKVGQNANAAISMSYISSSTNRISNDNSIFSPLINAFLGPAEYIPGMESDTVASAGSRLGSYFGYNTADQRKVQADQGIDRFVLGANANYTPLAWLRLNGNAGLDMFNRFDRQTINPNELPLAQSYILGFRNATRAANHLWTTNGSATGTFSLTPDLISTSTLGASYQRGLFETTDCYGVGIPSGTRSCGATTSQFAVGEGYTDERTVGGFARQEFAFADRLFVSASLRADNVSGLVRNVSGLSYFPSVNASWVVSRESFFPRVDAISQLRLRAGYGQAGQRPGYGAAETFFAPVASQQSGVEKPALVLTSTGNAALKVERTTEIEGGFDVGLLEDRVSAEYTVFTKRSRDALVQRNLPPSAGLTGAVFQNLGAVKNWGQEIGLSGKLVDMPNVKFDTRITATVLNNKVELLGQGIAPIIFNRGAQAHREGFPTGAFFARPIRWNDANGDGKLARNEVFVDSSQFLILPERRRWPRHAQPGVPRTRPAHEHPGLRRRPHALQAVHHLHALRAPRRQQAAELHGVLPLPHAERQPVLQRVLGAEQPAGVARLAGGVHRLAVRGVRRHAGRVHRGCGLREVARAHAARGRAGVDHEPPRPRAQHAVLGVRPQPEDLDELHRTRSGDQRGWWQRELQPERVQHAAPHPDDHVPPRCPTLIADLHT